MSVKIIGIKEIIKKILIMITNSILAFYLAYQFTNSSFSYLILGLIFGLSFLMGEILAPILVISTLITSNTTLIKELATPASLSIGQIESLLFSLIFFLIIPIIQLGVWKNSRGFISSESILAASSNPMASMILYFSGISFNEDYLNGILSALPFLYLILKYGFNDYIIIAVILLLVGAIIYSYNQGLYSITGVIPLAISSYLISSYIASPYIYYGVVLSVGINVADRVFNVIKDMKENKASFQAKKDSLIEELKNISSVLYALKNEIDKNDTELVNLLNVSLNSVTSIQNKVNECKDLECLKKIEDEVANQNRLLVIETNNLIFDEIRNYNEFVQRLKKIGINLSEIEYPKKEIKLPEFVDFYKRLKDTINAKIILATNLMNNFIENVDKSVGMQIEKISIIKQDNIISKLNELDPNIIDKRLNSCISKALDILQLFREEENYEIVKSLSDLQLQSLTLNKLNSAKINLEKINNVLLVSFSALYNSITILSKVYGREDIENLINITNVGIQALQTPDMPYCEKISKIYSYISELREAIELASNKDSLMQLSELVDSVMPTIVKTGELKLSDIGISEKYANFIIALLQKKGFKAEVEGDKILVRINSKNLP